MKQRMKIIQKSNNLEQKKTVQDSVLSHFYEIVKIA